MDMSRKRVRSTRSTVAAARSRTAVASKAGESPMIGVARQVRAWTDSVLGIAGVVLLALAIVAVVYGTLVALGVLYHLLWLNASPIFWLYFLFDVPFLIVFYGLFIYHDLMPRLRR